MIIHVGKWSSFVVSVQQLVVSGYSDAFLCFFMNFLEKFIYNVVLKTKHIFDVRITSYIYWTLMTVPNIIS